MLLDLGIHDNILIPVNIKRDLSSILIVVSINDRSIRIYDSLSGALQFIRIENEIKKYAQLVPMYLSKSHFYGRKALTYLHTQSTSPTECDSFEMIYVNDIPQQDAEASNGNVVPKSFDSSSHVFNMLFIVELWVQKIQADATSDKVRHQKANQIHRDCDSSEKITIN
ncbi:hypothetical protein H5410_001087 [Solanum commersonii]|uniref:Ubiquitin-like protease family profile domain-containing protein n=1 Tax=Solanum commersonii TaxID=4109 RepID=A0A9J6AYL3_SOLCO|nr:hypothetical protein H5410_001087 [Solanum commersonii]